MKTFDQRILTMDVRTILFKLLGSFGLYFAPISTIVHAVLALLLIDWITGVWKSKLVKRRITSYRLRKSMNKTGGYLFAIITAHIVDYSLLDSSLHLASIASAYIGFTELTSIYENLSEITGKKFLKDLAVYISKQVKEKFKIQ